MRDYSAKEPEAEVKAEPVEDNIVIPIAQPIPSAHLWHLEGGMCN